jgi:hypothetical protein
MERRRRHAHHDEVRRESLGELGRPVEDALCRVRGVVADEDRLHGASYSHKLAFDARPINLGRLERLSFDLSKEDAD